VELLTVQETAQLLKLSPVTVRRFIAAGRLPAVKVGRAVRIRRDAIEGLLAPVRPAPTPARPPNPPAGSPSDGGPLRDIIGIADSPDGPTDISANVDAYLTDAYEAESRR